MGKPGLLQHYDTICTVLCVLSTVIKWQWKLPPNWELWGNLQRLTNTIFIRNERPFLTLPGAVRSKT